MMWPIMNVTALIVIGLLWWGLPLVSPTPYKRRPEVKVMFIVAAGVNVAVVIAISWLKLSGGY